MCVIEGCERVDLIKKYGLCRMHWKRWYRTGDPHKVRTTKGMAFKEVPGYKGLHVRIKKAKGRAAEYKCVTCDSQAAHWAYQHNDPNELTGEHMGYAVKYSLNIDLYEPMCLICHNNLDHDYEGSK